MFSLSSFSLAQKNKDNKENLENYSAAADVFFLFQKEEQKVGKRSHN